MQNNYLPSTDNLSQVYDLSHVAGFLEDNGKPVAARCLQEFWGPRMTKNDLQIWFQRHFGREQAYKLFHAMEFVVSDNITQHA